MKIRIIIIHLMCTVVNGKACYVSAVDKPRILSYKSCEKSGNIQMLGREGLHTKPKAEPRR